MDYAELSNYEEGVGEGEAEGAAGSPMGYALEGLSGDESGDTPTRRSATARLGNFGRRFAAKLSQAVNTIGANTVVLGDAMNRSALSASEVVGDSDLRRKGAEVVITGAKATLQDLRRAINSGASTVRSGITRGFQPISNAPKSVQSVLSRVQHRIQQQRLRILLAAAKDDPVDVQIGPQLYEDAPQELRSRLWCALVANPGIGMAAYHKPDEALPAKLPASAIAAMCRQESQGEEAGAAEAGTAEAAEGEGEVEGCAAECSEPAASGSPVAAAAAESASPAAGAPRPLVGVELVVLADEEVRVLLDTWGGMPAEAAEGDTDDVAALYNDMCLAARKHSKADAATRLLAPLRHSHGRHAGVPSDNPMYRVPSTPHSLSWDEVGDHFLGEWEVVGHWTDGAAARGGSGGGGVFGGGLSPEETAQLQRKLGGLLRAMWEIEWPIPTAVPEDSRYATLLQISVGQEDVDEVITRDIHRTFPEHPQFGLEDVGQAALFNVLKAYSLHDLEVGYCQGMAFVAGVLLMYLPEEPAFQAFCSLMDSTGPDLRRFYLPGLEGLKFYLALFEELLVALHPAIAKHLQVHGIPPMLYASQWFLTAFACPFPTTFASRVIDVMLAEHQGGMLMRVALAVMAECEAEIVELDDFEDIITHLKVEPCHWGTERTRAVLNRAVHGVCTEQQIADAEAAVKANQESVNMCRAPSRVTLALPPDAGEAGAAGQSDLTSPAVAKRSAVEQMVRERSFGEVRSPDGQGGLSRQVSDAETGEATEDIQAQLDAQQEDMQQEYMAMVLAMDMMLDGSSAPGSPEQASQGGA
eukprot:jgi/Tetstr1/445692/TSEL_003495.t1